MSKQNSRFVVSIPFLLVALLLGNGVALANGGERYQILDDVYHYIWYEPVGPGPYDVIRVHRIVKETAPGQPKVTDDAVFLIHGAYVTFRTCFLTSLLTPSTPEVQSFAVYLALRNVDVWGIDHSSILVPVGTEDFSFMANWDLQRQIDEIAAGLEFAQTVREETDSGHEGEDEEPGKLHYLGFSQGGTEGYAYLNMESQEPCSERRVRGFIPVDIRYKTDVEDSRLNACSSAAAHRDKIANGLFQQPAGITFLTLGSLAETNPDGPSPIIPGLSNLQAMLFVATRPTGIIEWHFWAGTFGESGLPDGLEFTSVPLMLDWNQSIAPYEPRAASADADDVQCDEIDVPFDDHLFEIDVPVLYVGAGGGFGEFGVYSTMLLGSTDVTTHIVSLEEERLLDFAHGDVFTADHAKQLVWRTILEWIRNHRSDPCQ